MCEAYTLLKRETARIGLKINATKTKYLLGGDSDHLGSSVLVDGDNLEVIKEFCYLGRSLLLGRWRAAFFSDSARLHSSSNHYFFSLRYKRPILCLAAVLMACSTSTSTGLG